MNNINILIGSSGGLTGVYLVKYFGRMNNPRIRIHSADSNQLVITKYISHKFHLVPSSDDEKKFIDRIIKIMNKEKIDIYFPTHSKETIIVSKFRELINNRTNCSVLISKYDTYLNLNNKRIAYNNIRKLGINTPIIYSRSNIAFPAFMKPQVGSGSSSIFILNNNEEYRTLINKYPDSFIMSLEKGEEYTVDCLFDESSKLVTYNQRVRIKTLGGAAIITRNKNTFDSKKIIENIGESFEIVGPCNFQFFLKEDGTIVVFDINLRFASGGLPLSVASGADIIYGILSILNPMSFPKRNIQSDKKDRTMFRYFNEEFIINADS